MENFNDEDINYINNPFSEEDKIYIDLINTEKYWYYKYIY